MSKPPHGAQIPSNVAKVNFKNDFKAIFKTLHKSCQPIKLDVVYPQGKIKIANEEEAHGGKSQRVLALNLGDVYTRS
jgi:hypothetical protein